MSDLFPPNATAQERAISEAIDRTVPVVVREMWNPDTCPAGLLPWLAWAYSIDAWSVSWTEEQKRGAIKASVEVHKHKGTIGALMVALGGLGYDIEVKEWFETSPPGEPYTFSLDLIVDQVGIPSDSAYNKIVEVAESVKNLRSHLNAHIRGLTHGTEYIAAACLVGEKITISAEPEI